MTSNLETLAEEYLSFLRTHPLALDICYLVDVNRTLTAALVSRYLRLAIQTSTNALRELEAQEILESEKPGRERIYRPKQLHAFRYAMGLTPKLEVRGTRFKGQVFPIEILLENVVKDLKKLHGLSAIKHSDFKTTLIDLQIDILLSARNGLSNLILISRIDDDRAYLQLLGKLLVLSTSITDIGVIEVVSLFETNSKFRSLPVHESIKRILAGKVIFVEEYANALTLMSPAFSKKLTSEIVAGLRSGRRRS